MTVQSFWSIVSHFLSGVYVSFNILSMRGCLITLLRRGVARGGLKAPAIRAHISDAVMFFSINVFPSFRLIRCSNV